MVFPLARDSEIASLDLDHATYVVYKTEADSMCWGGRLLSLKVVFRGQVRFQLYNHMQYTLGTGEYLILNADKEYDIYKESRQPVETLGCILRRASPVMLCVPYRKTPYDSLTIRSHPILNRSISSSASSQISKY